MERVTFTKMSITRNKCACGSDWETNFGRRGILSNTIAMFDNHLKSRPTRRLILSNCLGNGDFRYNIII